MILDKTLFVYSSFSAEFYLLSSSSNYEGGSNLGIEKKSSYLSGEIAVKMIDSLLTVYYLILSFSKLNYHYSCGVSSS
jgi:hypothetical protein